MFLDGACVLAIHAQWTGSNVAGTIASTSTGVVTDDTWKCSAVEQTDWHLPGFGDSAWSQAQVMGANDGSHSEVITAVSAQAKWIWAQDPQPGSVYCRKMLC